MDNKKVFAFLTLGRTAAGKTTLAKYLCSTENITYIPEAEIKRRMVESYSIANSLDEELRDIGYKEAIKLTTLILSLGNDTLIDAAFHKHFRREWLYSELSPNCNGLFLFYCKCDNINKVERRINIRKQLPKDSATQADSMKVYNFIDSSFDEPSINSIEIEIPVCIFFINTNQNIISNIEVKNSNPIFDKKLTYLKEVISNYLINFQNDNNT